LATPNYGFEKRQKELAKKKKKEDKLKLKSEIKSGLRSVDQAEDETHNDAQDVAAPPISQFGAALADK
jgi:hypothetical protein